MASRSDIESMLLTIVKRYDRIGFGRNGALDAETEIRDWHGRLSEEDRLHLKGLLLRLIEAGPAEEVAHALHYNLREQIQAMALMLCGSLPIPESYTKLKALAEANAFASEDEAVVLRALTGAIARLDRVRAGGRAI